MRVALVIALVLLIPAVAQAQQPTSSPLYEKCAMADPPEPTPKSCESPPRCRTRACRIRVARRNCAWLKPGSCVRYVKLLKARCKCGRCRVVVHRF